LDDSTTKPRKCERQPRASLPAQYSSFTLRSCADAPHCG